MTESSANVASDHPRLLITAGPTHEPIDAVRYVGNRSSGRMGIALAERAAARGWPTTLLLGPTQLLPDSSSQVSLVRFQTAAELQSLLREHWPDHDILIMSAAVADYRPVHHDASDTAGTAGARKLRRSEQALTLTLEPTPDLLVALAEQTRADQTVIGFALEPAEVLVTSASEKLARKNLHAIVANPLETMDAPIITATVLLRDGRRLTPLTGMRKPDFAEWLLDQVGTIRTLSGRQTDRRTVD